MSDATKLKEKLFNQKKNGWEGLTEKQRNEIFNYCNGYMGYLNKGKTEREIVKTSKEMAEKAGHQKKWQKKQDLEISIQRKH